MINFFIQSFYSSWVNDVWGYSIPNNGETVLSHHFGLLFWKEEKNTYFLVVYKIIYVITLQKYLPISVS